LEYLLPEILVRQIAKVSTVMRKQRKNAALQEKPTVAKHYL
jgi:hypothetical protein